MACMVCILLIFVPQHPQILEIDLVIANMFQQSIDAFLVAKTYHSGQCTLRFMEAEIVIDAKDNILFFSITAIDHDIVRLKIWFKLAHMSSGIQESHPLLITKVHDMLLMQLSDT
ncbi:hypothetical protein RIB2604_02007130 [Aspergillus luchuensis]|uniref:Uncharacterized protein n=1 Tax=Aspergillus kawachii TaxID=1069201 RepID=A0A146FIY1_ASPKA|nr:hypothetical protein RIB2604_02007130 [Aspergillus luchuensis]